MELQILSILFKVQPLAEDSERLKQNFGQKTKKRKKEKKFYLWKTEREKRYGNMEDVVLFVQDLKSNYGISYCRICHEGEFENFKSLETPCACSGTVKVKSKAPLSSVGGFWSFFFKFWLIISFLLFVFSSHTEIAYRGGATRRATQLVKYASRYKDWSKSTEFGFGFYVLQLWFAVLSEKKIKNSAIFLYFNGIFVLCSCTSCCERSWV